MGDVHDGGSLGVTFVRGLCTQENNKTWKCSKSYAAWIKIDHLMKQQSILKTEKKCTALMLILCLRCAILGCVSGGARKIIKPGQKFKNKNKHSN